MTPRGVAVEPGGVLEVRRRIRVDVRGLPYSRTFRPRGGFLRCCHPGVGGRVGKDGPGRRFEAWRSQEEGGAGVGRDGSEPGHRPIDARREWWRRGGRDQAAQDAAKEVDHETSLVRFYQDRAFPRRGPRRQSCGQAPGCIQDLGRSHPRRFLALLVQEMEGAMLPAVAGAPRQHLAERPRPGYGIGSGRGLRGDHEARW